MREPQAQARSTRSLLALTLLVLLVPLMVTMAGAAAALAANGTVTGKVTEVGSGLPLADVHANFNGLDPANEGVGAGATTAADGSYRISLPAGGYRVEFVRFFFGTWVQYFNGHDSIGQADRMTVVAGKTTSGVSGQLPHVPAGWMRGTVSDADTGVPLVDAGVTIFTWDGNEYYPDYQCSTDLTGSFSKLLPPGTYRVKFNQSGYPERYYSDHVLFEDADPVVVADGQTTTGVDGALHVIPGYIDGVTRDCNGELVAGITVDAVNATTGAMVATGVSDQDGRYRLEPVYGAPGLSLAVRFTDPGATFPVQFSGGVTTLAAATKYSASPGWFHHAVNASLFTGTASIAGTLRDEDGRPVPDVLVRALRSHDLITVATATTDASGHYLLAPLPVAGTSSYKVHFDPPGGLHFEEYWRDTTNPALATPLELTAGTALIIDDVLGTKCSITGHVGDLKGLLSGISVTLYDAVGRAIQTLPTSSGGEYTFDGLRVGEYAVGFADPTGRHLPEYFDDAVTRGDATAIILSAAAPAAVADATLLPTTISGVVRGVGNALRNIRTTLYEDGVTVATTVTNDQGAYDFGPVAPGDYRIGFDDPSGDWVAEFFDDAASLDVATPIRLAAGKPYAIADAELSPNLSIRGSVGYGSDAGWRPPWPDDINVTLHRLDGSIVGTVVTGDLFAFRTLTPGDYRLSFVDPSGGYVSEYYSDAPGCALTASIIHVDEATPHIWLGEQLEPAVGPPGARADGGSDVVAEIVGPVNNGGLGNAMDMAGDTLVIGAKWQRLGVGGHNPGVAYVYERRGGAMIRTAVLSSPVPVDYGCFGSDVATDGDRLVAAEFRDDGRGLHSGAVHVFERGGAGWELRATLRPSGTDALLHRGFGAAVAMSGDTIVVGAPYAKLNGETEAGVAYVFTQSDGVWKQQARLTAAAPRGDDFFGRSVAVEGDRLVVGADMDDTAAGVNAGSAFVFARSGATWTRIAMLQPSDADIGVEFGGKVAISGDTVMITAVGQLYDQGALYVFAPSGSGWSERARLTAGDGQPNDRFGQSLALDGDTAVVGAAAEGPDDTSAGAAYRFTRLGGVWYPEARLTAAEGPLSRGVGQAVAVRGRVIAVSVSGYRRDPELAVSGAVRIFEPHRTAAGVPLVVPAADGVLSNDQGPTAEALGARLVDENGVALGDHAATPHGDVDLSEDGSFNYAPQPGYTGEDGFFYQAFTSEWASETTAVKVTVNDLTAPPIAVADLPKGWVNTPVTVTLSTGAATDVVASDYRPRGPNLWNRYLQPFKVSRQGATTYDIRARDVFGNSDAGGFTVRVDTKRPTPQAPSVARVRLGGTATLKYRIVDARPGSPTATVTIKVRNSRGAERWRAILKGKAVNKQLSYKFRCSLAAGTYRFTVSATDTAGNRETKPASNKLVVN